MSVEPFACMIGFPGFVGFPRKETEPSPTEEASSDSTTVDELDLVKTVGELFREAVAQASRRGLKVKRLRDELREARVHAAAMRAKELQLLASRAEAVSALSEVREERDRAAEAARSLGFDHAKAVTLIRRLQAAQKRRLKTVKRTQLPDGECCVCLDKQSTHAFVPCGHLCVCGSCAELLMRVDAKCPYCRARAQETCQIRFT